MYYTNKDIIRYTEGTYTSVSDKVIMEDEIEVICGQKVLGRFPCTDKEREELSLGLAYSQGYIVDQDTPVKVEGKRVLLPELPRRTWQGIIQSDLSYNPDLLLDLMQELRDKPGLFAETGGTHNGAWIYEGNLAIWSEDISRHCMVDKLVGSAIRNDWDFSRLTILLSCRVSESIMSKLVAVELPIVVSMSTVTDKAIEIARDHKMTLAGFARGRRMNIYTGKRIGKGD